MTFYAGWTVMALALCGGAYAVATAVLAGRALRQTSPALPAPLPAVTVLKPLRGGPPGLEAALTSFLAQTYAAPVQVVFGLHDAADPAGAVVARLKQRFPDHDITVVADSRLHGPNRKISNLINMVPHASHDVLVLADSDITAGPGCLQSVVAELSRSGTGAVSCLYTAEGVATVWSRLAAMDISYRFLPNAAFGIACGMAHPCFGSTIALTRGTLAAIGGFEALAGFLADDFELGRAVRARGLSIRYPALTVRHGCTESSLHDVVAHELRWARTIRSIDPAGHWGSVLTHTLPLGVVGAALLSFSAAACMILLVIVAARLFLKLRLDHITASSAGPAWFLPLRDVLSFGVFMASLFGSTVTWQGQRLRIGKRGAISQS